MDGALHVVFGEETHTREPLFTVSLCSLFLLLSQSLPLYETASTFKNNEKEQSFS